MIETPQRGVVGMAGGGATINLCANNYLGLSDNAKPIEAAQGTLGDYGFGMSSVRFICAPKPPISG